jgi:hypothetical protein
LVPITRVDVGNSTPHLDGSSLLVEDYLVSIRTNFFIIQTVGILALVSCCFAQDGNKVLISENNSAPSVRIFQSGTGSQPRETATTKDLGPSHVTEASFRGASSEELEGMELTLQQYKTAFDSLNLSQVRRVWPGLDRRRASALKDVFAYLRTTKTAPQLGLECALPMVMGASAKMDCRESLSYTDRGKIKQAKPGMVSIQLKKQSDNWVVDTMKGTGRAN